MMCTTFSYSKHRDHVRLRFPYMYTGLQNRSMTKLHKKRLSRDQTTVVFSITKNQLHNHFRLLLQDRGVYCTFASII
ncbi:hypothetical protein BOTBODRAFT_321675 [Botryobasidium botryosum FD-172 SS1]|uniref:Uncharacterized protein n=1 Tax=Botryobasidium botryosum (strain FD-172 SS1) TaxID=930990 RepID=A0A067MYT2_BOTB1|nr:hypothetical protein BOTBODRAFT_321675 [Botryobasidium botryosum FD-172 SS1]